MHSQEFKRKFQVRVVSPNVNYWVVRAGEDAAYLSHFHRNNLVAIGHLDKMEYLSTDLELGLPLVTLLSKYKERLIKEKSSKASATNKSGQVYRFVTEMKVGDVIISLDESNILTGVITSDAYKDSSQKVIRGIDDSIVGEPLTYSLRRNVSWGNRVSREAAPAAVRSSLRANQAVFCVSDHWQTLNHWLSVVFTKDDAVYFSSKIMQREQISNFDVSQFSHILNLFEAVSSELLNYNFYEVEDLDKFVVDVYNNCLKNRNFHLKTQQSFMSPGDYWGSLSGDKIKNILFVMAFCSLFNCEAVFADGMDMEIAEAHKESMDAIVNHIKQSQGFEYVKEGLKVNLPKPHELSLPRKEPDNTDNNVLDFPSDEPSDTGEI